MFGVFEAREVAKRADVREIHFRGLDQPFSDIGEIGAQHHHLIGGFEHGEPCLDGVDRNAEVPGDIGQIQELGASGRQDPKEILILAQVPDLPEHSHVPFKIGLDVAGMPKRCIPVGLCRKFRVPSSKEVLPQLAKDM